jgi:hypothetical protein
MTPFPHLHLSTIPSFGGILYSKKDEESSLSILKTETMAEQILTLGSSEEYIKLSWNRTWEVAIIQPYLLSLKEGTGSVIFYI